MPNSWIVPHFVTSAVILYGFIWGSTWPLIIATILHSLLPWSPMLLYKLWSQFCCISYEANAVELGIIQVCHCENSRRAPSLPFAGALGQPWFVLIFHVKQFGFVPIFLCGSAHKKEEPFNLLWVLKNEISTQNESIASTCRAVRTSVSCPNTITQTAIRIIFVCSSVLGFQWSRISQPYLCV